MTSSLYLSRARLRTRRGEALSAIAPLLLPRGEKERHAAAHRIVWMLFQQTLDAGREPDWRNAEDGQGFLWRDEGDGRYLILSRARPMDQHGLFDVEAKEFVPNLSAGDRLRFALRANPVISTKAALSQHQRAARARGKRVDVVMHALKDVPKTDWSSRSGRAFERDRIITDATRSWLEQQGARHGFSLSDTGALRAEGYSQIQVARDGKSQRRAAGISVVDLEGEITIRDPTAFLARLPLGFGSAKAFGCGLMLIRRA